MVDAIERFHAVGVETISVSEPFINGRSAGRRLLRMLGQFAELERDVIRQRISAGMRRRNDARRQSRPEPPPETGEGEDR